MLKSLLGLKSRAYAGFLKSDVSLFLLKENILSAAKLCTTCARHRQSRLHPHDFFGFDGLCQPWLTKTLKFHENPPHVFRKELDTKTRRLKPVNSGDNIDTRRFAIETLTERVSCVDFPEEYTIEPLKKFRHGGRDPHTGRIAVHRRGGGIEKQFRWIDFFRLGASEETDLEEKVLWISYDLNRTNYIALVANGVTKRYILATDGMKVGDVILSTRRIPDKFEELKPGNCHPLGAMPDGSVFCQVELYPRTGAAKMRAAGSSARIVRRLDNDMILVKMPHKAEFALNKHCLAVVGSNANKGLFYEHIGSANRKRWMGIRPKSGKFTKKTGRFGRKLNKKVKSFVFDVDKQNPYVGAYPSCRK